VPFVRGAHYLNAHTDGTAPSSNCDGSFSLVNPLICGTMFAQIEAGQTPATRLEETTIPNVNCDSTESNALGTITS
jgi:hypothetical protein